MKRGPNLLAARLAAAVGLLALGSVSCGSKKEERGFSGPAANQTASENQTQPVSQNRTPDEGRKPAFNFTLSNLEGRSVSLSDYSGKVVMVDFWATWCGPCRQEIPHLKELYAENKDRGFEILAVAMDENGSGVVPPFVKANQIPYPVLLGTSEIEELFGGILGYPTTFLIDRTGKIADKVIGYQSKQFFEAKLKPLLETGG